MSTRLKLIGPLVLWTVFVWASRIRNIWADDELTTGGQVLRTGYALVFLAFAAVMAQRLWARRGSELTRGDVLTLGAFVVWSIGFWLIRGVGIIVDDHTTSFTVVHTVLMVVSIGVALLAARLLPRPSISSSRLAAR